MLVEAGGQADRVREIKAEDRLSKAAVVRGFRQGTQGPDDRGTAQGGQCQLVGVLRIKCEKRRTNGQSVKAQLAD